ncbi:hypothetical protein CUZ56_01782 [Saezia sanguinis]|uniref:PNPLA domain-containing protein n=1 Tax=Saezia sanguinis TaxID=1965230 RepID=A0A433SCN1_9BURK|nr:patatin-like phospholipase family protein [Saezia sanguinis]RUS66502.1 hypothetical protein CUZ56_01782 [Saezia sanguinis]
MPPANSPRKTINLALQGGGAHGAFTWGVLDALLEDGRLGFSGISGTSAGAMNAVVLAHGLLSGGNDGARQALTRFWQAIIQQAALATLPFGYSSSHMLLQWSRFMSPQQINPMAADPLRDILQDQIDFEHLRRACPLQLFVAATNANTGKLRLFENHELSAQALLASACLPTIHRAVEIDGEFYWDGGYSANPAVFPLYTNCPERDILLVLLNPLQHLKTPKSAEDIRTRSLDLAFNAAFLREMQMLTLLREQSAFTFFPSGRIERRVKKLHFHLINAEDLLPTLALETKLVPSRSLVEMLFEQGRTRTQEWLASHFEAIDNRSTLDLQAVFN